MADELPIFDLAHLGHFPESLSDLIKASEEWGCFRIKNFNSILPFSLMQEMKNLASSLLDLPLEIKQRNVDNIVGSGYRSSGPINPIHEGLGLYDIASDLAVDKFCDQLQLTPYQREIVERYAKGVNELIKDIGSKVGEGLGLKEVPFTSWPCQFRINKYPFTSLSIGSDGLKTHSDSGFLTIIQDDEQFGGLEVMRKSGKFVPVEPCPGTLVVNFGDTAVVWSNGRFHNVKHRVVCKQEGNRISIATFLSGPKKTIVEAPPELVTSENPRLYVPFQFEEFRKIRFHTQLNAGEALDYFLLKP